MNCVDLTAPVWVRLTDLSLNYLRGYYRKDFNTFEKEQRVGEWYQFSLGDLIKVFGPITHQGMGTPFIDNQVCLEKPY